MSEIRSLKFLVNSGNPFAMFELADCYLFGNVKTPHNKDFTDYNKAFTLYQNADSAFTKFNPADPSLDESDDMPISKKIGESFGQHSTSTEMHAATKVRLAMCYRDGLGCDKSDWYAKHTWSELNQRGTKDFFIPIMYLVWERYGKDCHDYDKAKEISNFEFKLS